MAFLNEPEGGGETNFPEAGIKITPRTGKLMMDAGGVLLEGT